MATVVLVAILFVQLQLVRALDPRITGSATLLDDDKCVSEKENILFFCDFLVVILFFFRVMINAFWTIDVPKNLLTFRLRTNSDGWFAIVRQKKKVTPKKIKKQIILFSKKIGIFKKTENERL